MSSEFTRGGFTALDRAAEYAKTAGKPRTSAWLAACAALVEHKGFQADWPEAPAYKGFVVHIENPETDLHQLSDVELEDLARAVANEQVRRKRLGCP
jgi:hypothetical protein